MVRVALVITRSDVVGGANVHVRDLSVGLSRRGVEPVVLVGGSGPYLSDLTAHDVPFEVVPHLERAVHPLHDVRAYRALRTALRRHAPDLVAAHTAKSGALGRMAARSLGIPVVYTPHCWAFDDGVPALRATAYRLAERRLSRGRGLIVDVSHHDRRVALARGVGHPAQHVTIHNGVPDVRPELLAAPGREPPRLLMVARFEPQKDHRTLLAALEGLAHLPWTLDLVGDGRGRAGVAATVRAAGFADRVAFLGAQRDVAPWYARAQVFVLASHWESLPLTVLEAMRSGLPVVASDVGGIPEAVDDGVSGLLVPRGDAGALREALAELLADPELRVRMGEEGRERFRRVFSHERMLDRLSALYLGEAGSRRGSPAGSRRTSVRGRSS